MADKSIVNTIQEYGYWDVAIRPEPFDADRLDQSLLRDALASSVVRLRGWPLPMIDERTLILRGNDWIGQDIDGSVVGHFEAWRLFTSGQFIQLRTVAADRSGWSIQPTSRPLELAGRIEVWEILFYLTELVELGSRLQVHYGDSSGVKFDLSLRGMTGRQLVGNQRRELFDRYVSAVDELRVAQVIDSEQLALNTREIAVQLSQKMLAKFGFNASDHVLTDYQSELTRGH